MKVLLHCFFLLLFACSGSEPKTDLVEIADSTSKVVPLKVVTGEAAIIEPVTDSEIKTYTKDGITLEEIKAEEYNNATLKLSTKQFKEGANNLSFNIENINNYNIAILENNYTLNFFDTPHFKKEFLYGNNVFLAFLTDQNKLSVKKNRAHLLKNVIIGDMDPLFNMNQPHLFYYLPQPETSMPILDFYLVNTAISATENKLKVTINNTEFIVDKWAAYTIKGLTKTNNIIRLQLIDRNGNTIDGPFNDSGDRSFVIKKEV
ncbi:MAG: hypothetical protein AB7O47_09915 [Flavobacteriales bacterium]